MYRVKMEDIKSLGKQVEDALNGQGYEVELKTNFCYGAYGYYFNFKNGAQFYTGLMTKKELHYRFWDFYYKILANEKIYKSEAI